MVLKKNIIFSGRTLKGSIAEVVVALFIFGFVIAFGFVILSNMDRASILKAKNLASEIAGNEMGTTLYNNDFLDKEEEIEGFNLIKTIDKNANNNTIDITIQVLDKKEKILASEHLIIEIPAIEKD